MSLFLILQDEIVWLLAIMYLLSLITFDIFSTNRQTRLYAVWYSQFSVFPSLGNFIYNILQRISTSLLFEEFSHHLSLLHNDDSYFVSRNDRITRKCSLTTAEYNRWTYLLKCLITFDIISTYYYIENRV